MNKDELKRELTNVLYMASGIVAAAAGWLKKFR